VTFDARERSVAESEPIEFYRFSRGSGDTEETWLHVNGTETLTLNGETYDPTPGLTRSAISQSPEDSSMQVTVTLPRDVCVATEYRGSRSIAPIMLVVWRAQRGLDDSEAKPIYTGETGSPVFEGSTLTLTCKREESRWSERLGRVRCQRACPHMLFDQFCGADPDAVTFSAKITAINDTLDVITVEEQDAPPGSDHLDAGSHYYNSGTVKRAGRHVFVIAQDEGELKLQTPLLDAVEGDIVRLTAGCNRQASDCADIHSNIERFGGFELIPDRNPWRGVR
jgi:uncharacterized phage protein (TIGR02218 family)